MVGSGKGTIWQTTFGHRIGTDGQESPLLVNLKPSGEFLMEDFFYAGGLPAVLENIKDIIDGDAPTVTGQPFSSYADPRLQQRLTPRSFVPSVTRFWPTPGSLC